LITEAASLEQRIEALRQGNLAYEVNQPLKYIPVQAAQTLPESQRSIVEGLNELRQEMEARGLEFQPVPAEAMTQLLDTISLLTDNVIVVVYSAKNVLPGEKVEVTFEIAYDRVIFRKGEVLTRINIDADVNRDKLPALFANAFAAIRNVALAKGMLPNIGTGDVGAITSTDVAKAAEEIEAVQGKRVMEIRAGRDFKTTDTMDSFEIVVKKA
jgi:ACT domain-containing protein